MFKLRFPPMINDLSTCFDPVPEFEAIKKIEPNRNYAYPNGFRSKQLKFYQDLRALEVPRSAKDTFEKVKDAARRMRDWKLISIDDQNLRVEGTALSRVLRLQEDFVIEVRPLSDSLTRVCMRSKSRVGRWDWGANADRIEGFLKVLEALLKFG